jgi:hypothetical protein
MSAQLLRFHYQPIGSSLAPLPPVLGRTHALFRRCPVQDALSTLDRLLSFRQSNEILGSALAVLASAIRHPLFYRRHVGSSLVHLLSCITLRLQPLPLVENIFSEGKPAFECSASCCASGVPFFMLAAAAARISGLPQWDHAFVECRWRATGNGSIEKPQVGDTSILAEDFRQACRFSERAAGRLDDDNGTTANHHGCHSERMCGISAGQGSQMPEIPHMRSE